MRKYFLFLFLLSTISLNSYAQVDKLFMDSLFLAQKEEIEKLMFEVSSQQKAIEQQKYSIEILINSIVFLETKFDSLSEVFVNYEDDTAVLVKKINTRIGDIGESANTKIEQLGNNIDKNSIYWTITIVAILVLGTAMYLFFKKRIRSNQTNFESQIKETQKALEEDCVKLDSKLVGVLETQLELIQDNKQGKQQSINISTDHSLALKIANEIIRIQKNIRLMDSNTRGLKQLSASVERIQDNLAAYGYELVEMLGKEYNEGMKAEADFIQDDNIEDNKRIITRIIKPQVNYNGIMIQVAKIEVSEN